MEKQLFNLKFTAKQLQRLSKKCQKDEEAEKVKTKKAIQQSNVEGAKIHAANAIRKKNEALNYLRLSSRIDAVASRVQTAVTMKTMTKSMAGVVQGMDMAMQNMNLEKISMVMDKFESQFEDLDVQTAYMDGAMKGSTSQTTPEDEVERLMQQVADEHGLELGQELNAVGAAAAEVKDEELNERLSKLRNQ